jgi:RES domain-containing protein
MRKIRAPELLDRLQGLASIPFQTKVWRMAKAGRNPLVATSPKGRWDDGSFDVIYAALDADAARAEVHYHLTRGQPVYPSTLQIHLHELRADIQKAVVFKNLEALQEFGVNPDTYGTFDYARLQAEYSITQQMGEAAHFLGLQAIVVPSARWPQSNIVVMAPDVLLHAQDHGPQDLKSWARQNTL